MAKTPIEMIRLHEDWFEGTRKGLSIGLETGNVFLTLYNYEGYFIGKLMQGLITWRIDAGSPMKYFVDAIAIANETIQYINTVTPDFNVATEFPFEIAGLLAFIINEPFKVPEIELKGLTFDRLLRYELVKSLHGAQNEKEWDTLLAPEKDKKRTQLAYNTYTLYKNMIFHPEYSEIDAFVKEGETLFRKRSRNAFYDGGPSYCGGGPDNDVTVDFELAAVMKFVGYSGPSMHRYRW